MHIKFLLSFDQTPLFINEFLFCCSFLKSSNSSGAETNQEVTKRVMEAIVADHVGTEKCAWSSAKMKGMNKELKLFAGLQKRLTVSLRFNQNLPIHPEIIHSASSILFRVIPVISQPPFGMEICFNICSQTLSVLEKSWKFVFEKGY